MSMREDGGRSRPAREDVRGLAEGMEDTGLEPGRSGAGAHPIPRARLASSGKTAEETVADALGWFSLALGLAEVLAPARVNRMIGAPDHPRALNLVRACGVREIVNGLGILTRPHPAGWVQARVGGDLVDLALLGAASRSPEADRRRLAGAAAAVLGVAALDAWAGARLASTAGVRDTAVHVARAITIRSTPREVYDFWRDFANLPLFMIHLEDVQVLDERLSRWKAKAPAGMTVTWEAETVEDVPGERISWRSLPGADVDNSGTVTFTQAPRGRGTEVHVDLHYRPPAGTLGSLVARLFGEEPEIQVGDDLHRLKQVLELGEVVVSDASPEGRYRSLMGQRAAQPLESAAKVEKAAKKGGRA